MEQVFEIAYIEWVLGGSGIAAVTGIAGYLGKKYFPEKFEFLTKLFKR